MNAHTGTAYTSTVVAPAQVVAAVAVGAVAAGLTLLTGPAWLAGLVLAVVVLAGTQLAVVRLVVSRDRVALGWGWWGRLRVIPRGDITTAGVLDLTSTQVYGIGVRTPRRTTRLTVRRGPALELRTTAGEIVRISTPEPATAADLLGVTTTPAAASGRQIGESDEQQ